MYFQWENKVLQFFLGLEIGCVREKTMLHKNVVQESDFMTKHNIIKQHKLNLQILELPP